jgi:pimeloyl-ACP methyl ester carboxylesterase
MSIEPDYCRVSLNGEDFNYLDWGGTGPLMHISHSIGFCSGIYTPFALQLKNFGRVVGMDSRGHGTTQAVADPARLKSWDILYRDLENFFDSLNRPLIALGHSMGGTISLVTAVKRPEQVRALILVEPGLMPPSWTATVFLLQKLKLTSLVPAISKISKRTSCWPDFPAAENYFSSRKLYATWERSYIEAFLKSNLAQRSDHVELRCSPKWESRCIATAPTNIWKFVAGIHIPTLIIHASGSTTFLPNVVRKLKKDMPHAVLVRLEGGHNLIMERPTEVLSVITDFLETNKLL